MSSTLVVERPVTYRAAEMAIDDGELLRAVHEERRGALWYYVVGLTHDDRTQAQDVAQETVQRACRNPQVLAQASGSTPGWLFTMAKPAVMDDWRTAPSRRERVSARLPERPVSDELDHPRDRHPVAAAPRTLWAEHRAVPITCYFRGSSVAGAAATLGVPPGIVKSRTHHALRALRLALE